jgi:hypothetical protein
VIVWFTYQQQDLGTVTVDTEPAGEDRYRIGGNYYSLAAGLFILTILAAFGSRLAQKRPLS